MNLRLTVASGNRVPPRSVGVGAPGPELCVLQRRPGLRVSPGQPRPARPPQAPNPPASSVLGYAGTRAGWGDSPPSGEPQDYAVGPRKSQEGWASALRAGNGLLSLPLEHPLPTCVGRTPGSPAGLRICAARASSLLWTRLRFPPAEREAHGGSRGLLFSQPRTALVLPSRWDDRSALPRPALRLTF